MSRLDFHLQATCPGSAARCTEFTTLHGRVRTPVFMPVGTQASVRGLSPGILRDSGSQVLLANTYHLLLRPGPEVFQRFGGIHRFMAWEHPVLTDSGGFQIFSLPHSRAMDEAGARFQSYVDGKEYLLSPETSIATQRAINSDIMMVLDQCIPATADHATAQAAMDLTHRWAGRSLAARGDSRQALFAIVQGACHPDLRRQSALTLAEMPFDGMAIGGLAVGEGKSELYDTTELVAGLLPADRPRYLMGVGTPRDILEAVHRGVDMFDCILPVALAHRGTAFTSLGKLQLRRSVYRLDESALDPACPCPTCREFSRAYLHHLIKADEIFGWQLVSIHNLSFYHRLTATMAGHIQAGTFAGFHQSQREVLDQEDPEHPARPPKSRLPKAKRSSRLGDYEAVENPGGWWSIRQISSGETMHSVSNPTGEARALYVEQPGLVRRLQGRGNGRVAEAAQGLLPPDGTVALAFPWTPDSAYCIWDVGLGAATNAMAAIQAAEELLALGRMQRPLRILSFERDLHPLRLATREAARFFHLRHPAPAALRDRGEWIHPSGMIHWRLREGDFLEVQEGLGPEEAPDLVWWDPFSFKTDTAMWSREAFTQVYRACLPRNALMVTYSASTRVRAALLWAGFQVATGVGTGPKADTTLACPRGFGPDQPGVPLDRRWLERWKRSQARYPEGADEALRQAMDQALEAHPQFQA